MDLLRKLQSAFTSEELLPLAGNLVRIPSHYQAEGKETEVARFLAGWFAQNGIKVTLRPVVEERAKIIAVLEGKSSGSALILNGHLDTVAPCTAANDLFSGKLHEGKLWGLGSVDMKGACAAMAMALVALKRSGLSLAGDLFFKGVINEELKSEGSEDIILNGPQADAVIVGEPTGLNLGAAHRGLEWIEIEVQGKAAHGSTPQMGVSAISKMAAFIRHLEEELPPRFAGRAHPLMGPPAYNLGVIRGGTQPGTVADRCILQIDRRLTPAESVASVLGELEEIIRNCAAQDSGFAATLRRLPDNMATMDHLAMEFPLDHPLREIIEDSVKAVTGRKPDVISFTGWTDAALFANQGSTLSVVFGPGSLAQAHSASEFCSAEEIVQSALIYALAAARFCGCAGGAI